MACVDFPNSPSINDTFTVDDTTWIWDGTVWLLVGKTVTGPQGFQGFQGLQGFQGPQGFQGAQGVGFSFSGEDTRVVYVASNAPATDPNFTWDQTNNTLSITSNTLGEPAAKLFLDDSSTTGAPGILNLYHNTSGTPANGLGIAINFYTETSTTVDTLLGSIATSWDNITHAARRSLMKFTGQNAALTNNILGLDGNQRIYTYGIHDNPTTIATTGSTQQIASGEYTPTLTARGGWAPSAGPTSACAQWLRVGNVVTVSGEFSVTPAGAGVGEVQIQVPIATAAGLSTCNISGTCGRYEATTPSTTGGIITSYNNGTSYDAYVQLLFGAAVANVVKYHFTYLIE